jgi:hypothetical protein
MSPRTVASVGALILLAALAPAQDAPPPPPDDKGGPMEVEWGVPEGKLPPLTASRRNTPRKARDAALDWLARHQGENGAWDAGGFDGACRKLRCPGKGHPAYAIGVTGLSTLAFLRAGRGPGPEGENARVAAALEFLMDSQDEEGCFGPREPAHYVYNHAIATLALCEARAVVSDPRIDAAARRGLDWIRAAQTPYAAWRYGIRPKESDASVTGWMVQALRTGTRAGLEVEQRVFDGALAFLGKVRNGKTGRYGYLKATDLPPRASAMLPKFPPELSESTTAVGLAILLECGVDARDPRVKEAAKVLLARPPEWNAGTGSIDFYYWYYATECFAWLGRDGWRKWSKGLEESIVPWQRGEKDGCAAGSWDPVDPWQNDGGRVYMTALGALMAKRLCERH